MFASIYIPRFHVQALVRSEPELLGKPLAVVDGVPPLLQVIEMNPAAQAAGVETGMAKLKLEHFFDVTIRQRSPAQETSAHAALLDCGNAFSPRVEATAPDTVVLDLDGLDRLFGSLHEIAARIYDQTILVGLQPNIALAANPGAAIHAAQGFEGLLVIAAGTERQRLSPLPLTVLTADSEVVETLHRWGVRTFGAFAALPASRIAERLGQHGVRLHKLARGAVSRPLKPYQETLKFEEVTELDHAMALLEPLTFVMSRLLDQLCRRLRVRSRATHELRVTLELDERGAAPHIRVLRLPLPICDAKILLKLAMLELESHPPKAAVVKVTVEAIPTRPRTVQNGLFTPLAPEAEKLELTLARIAHIVGRQNVGSPQLLDTHRPDAFQLSHSVIANGAGVAEGATAANLGFRQFRPALEASVQLRDGKPAWIAFHGIFGAITAASGPWHASGDWWRDDRWSREEWDVGITSRVKGFAMYRIYRDVASGRWFTEGVYD
jgi:protein ImuB